MIRSVVVADSSPLISLALIQQLELLPQLYKEVLVPSAVWNEVTVKGVGLPGAAAVSKKGWLQVKVIRQEVVEPIAVLVDRGEAEAIALAKSTPDSIALLDDAQARRVSKRLDVPCIGTLGILRKAKKAGLLLEIGRFTNQLQAKCGKLYIRSSLIEAVLRDVGKIESSPHLQRLRKQGLL